MDTTSLDASAQDRAKSPDIVSDFLLETLVERPVIRQRGEVSFMTAYTWRAPIKDLQLSALKILKRHLPPGFIDGASRQLCRVVLKLYGRGTFSAVVPVPCGHSLRPDCLSYQLAAAVAARLGSEFAAILSAPLIKGSSHPCESRKWRQPKVTAAAPARVLLVDDVSTTGRHLSLSINALRNAGADAAGVAWIGAR